MFDDEIPVGKADNLTGQTFGQLTVLYRCKSPYDDNGKNAWWKCECSCGIRKPIVAYKLKNGSAKTCGCNQAHRLDLSGQKFGKLTAIEPTTKRSRRMVVWKTICDCGNIKYVVTKDLTAGSVTSCGCLKSKGENKIIQILKNLSIDFISQIKFDECKDKKHLPFDFYLPEYNCCIEYDGEQHFKPVNHFGGEQQFKRRQKNDKIKTEYCIENDIRLIRIPYTDYDKLNEDYLLSFFRNIEC